MIFCPNMKCRAANPEEQLFCQNCQTRLPKRYLWVVNFSEQEFPIGTKVADRFIFRGPNVVIDTQPGLLLKTEFDIPDLLLPYLRLFSYRVHYSQFYSLLWIGEEEKTPLLLLENAPLCPTDLTQTVISDPSDQRLSAPVTPALPLLQAWSQAKPLRQLNWLWQISRLWDPWLAQGVAKSFLVPELLRVEGRFIRLLELYNDVEDEVPTLADLGQVWSEWKDATTGPNSVFFSHLCNDLISGELSTSRALTERLDSAIEDLRQDQPFFVSLATRTDVGVVRDHNEDLCFPPSGTLLDHSEGNLMIVCDGVGGHAGGEVASSTAIAALQEHIGKLELDALTPEQIMIELAAASCHANDLISQRNDDEQRLERQRMGTTLVMALVHNQQLFIAHIGDSRAYLITKLRCYQVTVDDDIASREVRLGYLPYREALRQPTSGSLVQALGMASSSILHPTVQRFILEDDCLLLLCSDGLSDYDRVEEHWQEELLPLLYRNYDLAAVSERLINLANQLNGHDNVTVALMRAGFDINKLGPKTPLPQTEVKQPVTAIPVTAPGLAAEASPSPSPSPASEPRFAEPPSPATSSETSSGEQTPNPTSSEAPQTLQISPASSSNSKFPRWIFGLIGILIFLIAGSVWAVINNIVEIPGTSKSPSPAPSKRPALPQETNNNNPATLPLEESPEGQPSLDSPDQETPAQQFKSNQFYTVTNEDGIKVFRDTLSSSDNEPMIFEPGTILRTVTQKVIPKEGNQTSTWIQVNICAPQSSDSDIDSYQWISNTTFKESTELISREKVGFSLKNCSQVQGGT